MEQRWNIRMPVRTNVCIRSPDSEAVAGRTRDLSFEGMYVETAPDTVSAHTFVQIEFAVRDGANWAVVKTPAMIVRSEEDGVGLMFPDYDDTVFDGLALLLARYFSQQQLAKPHHAGALLP